MLKKVFYGLLVKKDLLKEVKIGKLEFYEYCIIKKQTRVKFGTKSNFVFVRTPGNQSNQLHYEAQWFVSLVNDYPMKSLGMPNASQI